MTPPPDRRPDPDLFDALSLDVHDLLTRTEASLFSHLVTRPTGRAVRMAIEGQLRELGRPVLSLVDFSSVRILDYSCADEVVARLVLASRELPMEAWLLFRGLHVHHLDPVEAVLERHGVRAVVAPAGSAPRLVGPGPGIEARIWDRIEREGRVDTPPDRAGVVTSEEEVRGLESLVASRLVFRHPTTGGVSSLSALSARLAPDPGG